MLAGEARLPLPVVWPAAGIIAGILIVTERRRWIALGLTAAAALVLSYVLHQAAPVPALALAVICVLESAAVAWLVRRFIGEPFAFNRGAHTTTFILASIAVPPGAALLAATALTAYDAGSYVIAWRSWALADALGLLTAAPPAITAITERHRIIAFARSRRAWEFVLVFAATALVAAAIFGETLDPVIRVPAYVLPFLLWPAFRFGPGATAATVLTVSYIALWHAALGEGPLDLTDAPTLNVMLRSQGAMAVASVSLLLLASVVAERKRVGHENVLLVTELQQALAEVKTLRGFIPICAWCHKVRDDAGFWQQIEMYLDARTDATFSHSICPTCEREAHEEVDSHESIPHA